MNMRELNRLKAIEAVAEGRLMPWRAAERLGVSRRQIKHLVLRYRESGTFRLVSRRRGNASNHRLPEGLAGRTFVPIRERYADPGPTLIPHARVSSPARARTEHRLKAHQRTSHVCSQFGRQRQRPANLPPLSSPYVPWPAICQSVNGAPVHLANFKDASVSSQRARCIVTGAGYSIDCADAALYRQGEYPGKVETRKSGERFQQNTNSRQTGGARQMNAVHGSGSDSSLQTLWEDGERMFCRARLPGGSQTVLMAKCAEEYPASATLDRLAHEFALKDQLDRAWAVVPTELVRADGRAVLVFDDPGGELLERQIGTPMETGSVLAIAVAIAAALGKLHQCGLVHKDLKPAHILVNCMDGQVRLTGFGIASQLPRERQLPEPPETIAGTLAYMSPEQTGRMNRSIDSRSDLYGFGVVLYQMLTGVLPFTAADPMEWVHCHVARKAVPPNARVQTVGGDNYLGRSLTFVLAGGEESEAA